MKQETQSQYRSHYRCWLSKSRGANSFPVFSNLFESNMNLRRLVTSSHGLKPVGFPFRLLLLRPSPGRWFRKASYGSCDSRAFARCAFPARSPRQAWWVTLPVSVLGVHHPPWETETQVLYWGHHPARSRPKAQTNIRVKSI